MSPRACCQDEVGDDELFEELHGCWKEWRKKNRSPEDAYSLISVFYAPRNQGTEGEPQFNGQEGRDEQPATGLGLMSDNNLSGHLWSQYERPLIISRAWSPSYAKRTTAQLVTNYRRGELPLKWLPGNRLPINPSNFVEMEDVFAVRDFVLAMCALAHIAGKGSFFDLYLRSMAIFWYAVRAWHYLHYTRIRRGLSRLLLGMKYERGSKVDAHYRQLEEALYAIAGNSSGSNTHDAADTPEFIHDWIASNLVDVQNGSDVEIVDGILQSKYSKMRFKSRFVDRLRSATTRRRTVAVSLDDDTDGRAVTPKLHGHSRSCDRTKLTMDLLDDEVTGEASRRGMDEDQHWGVAPSANLPPEPCISVEGRSWLAAEFGRTAPDIVEAILRDPELTQKEVATRVGCVENTVTNVMKRLRSAADSHEGSPFGDWFFQNLRI